MHDDLVIRREHPDQPEVTLLLEALDIYLRSLYPPEANHILDLRALQAPGVIFHVVRRDGRAVGTGAMRCMPGDAATGGEAYGEVKRMYVVPSERGRRVGERMLNSLEAALLEEGPRLALLETGAEQVEAVRMYERCGYARRGPFGGYPDNGLSLFYAKRLP